MNTSKKLIEVALPLEKINVESIREGYIYRGNPSAIHKWWAQRPLAAARAVIFAQMVDDPSGYVDELLHDRVWRIQAERVLTERRAGWELRRKAFDAAEERSEQGLVDPGEEPTLEECAADMERQRLFRLIEQLVHWENTTNEDIIKQARDEIWKSWRRTCAANKDHPRAAELFNPEKLPAFHDPFAGGGTIPLEAQRLGLESYASDLNPVAVLINKAMIEIPPKFAGMPPVNPVDRKQPSVAWKGAAGLAADVRYYGQWMRDEAEKRIGQLYPKVEVTAAMVQQRPDLKPYIGKKLTIIAWLWARTVKSPNPAFKHIEVPLASTFMISTKVGKEAYIEPVIANDTYRFTVQVGKPKNPEVAKNGTKLSRGAHFRCIMSNTPIEPDYIRTQAQAGKMRARLMAIVAEGERERVFLSPTSEHEALAQQTQPEWKPETEFFQQALGFRVGNYGMSTWSDLFTSRQLVALTTFSGLFREVQDLIRRDSQLESFSGRTSQTTSGGISYESAILLYIAFAIDKYAMYGNSLVPWYPKESRSSMLFSQQVVSMVWDYTEVNPFSEVGGSLGKSLTIIGGALEGLPLNAKSAVVEQRDAAIGISNSQAVISTDPPYYDNVGYADLSDFFYVWLRRSLKSIFPDLFATLTVPKTEELVATPARHGGQEQAEAFFLKGMTQAMQRLAEHAHPSFPVTIYYAFKQSESQTQTGTVSTGWETFLDAVILAGFAINGTWPMRTERTGRVRDSGANALASSIVLVCRPRPERVPTVTRRDFVTRLKDELPDALRLLQAGNIAPVDLAQAAIGPGMAVFTRYAKVIDAGGNPLRVREALALINQTLDEVLAEQEGDFDPETRWAVTWFEQQGFAEGEYGRAETLATARNVSVSGMAQSGILTAKGGKARLLKPEELPEDWNPNTDERLTVWEMVHHLVRALGGGELAAAELLARLGPRADAARELAYRLYAICERKKRASEALAYNGLVQSWPEMLRLAGEQRTSTLTQGNLFEGA